jgi:hypothetical protein
MVEKRKKKIPVKSSENNIRGYRINIGALERGR